MLFPLKRPWKQGRNHPFSLHRPTKLLLIFLLGSLLQAKAAVFAQPITIVGKNIPIRVVLDQIQQQTDYVFMADDQVLSDVKPITIDAKGKSLEMILAQCFEHTNLIYDIEDKTVFIKRKPTKAAQTIPFSSVNDENAITGTVRNEKGGLLNGATITLRELKKTVVSDDNGAFFFRNIPNGNYTLLVSFVGFENHSQKVTVESNPIKINVNLKALSGSLDETVVKGYYNTTNRLNTGNVTVVKSNEINNQPIGDPVLALQGKVSGLYISQNSGLPGAAFEVLRLRGQNSISNGNDPLFVVDGVPFPSTSLTDPSIGGGASFLSPFSNISMSEIESIEVLKDADATAIYGSRGANGVILIITKKGDIGKPKISVDFSSGFGKVTNQLSLLNTQDYLALRHEAFNNDGITAVPSSNYDISGLWDTTRYTNWQKLLIGNSSAIDNARISMSGGNEQTQYLISGNYRQESTVLPGNFKDQKYSYLSTINHNSKSKRFFLQFSSSYLFDKSYMPGVDITSQILLAPDAPKLYDSLGNLNWQNNTWNNPMGLLLRTATSKTSNLNNNSTIGFSPLKNFTIKANIGYNEIFTTQQILTPLASYRPSLASRTNMRNIHYSNGNQKRFIFEPQLDYKRTFTNFDFNCTLGATYQTTSTTNLAETASNFSDDASISNPMAGAVHTINNFLITNYKYGGFYSRVNLNFQSKYLLNLTARRDGSSRFGPNKRFGNFGAIGVGWLFTRENWFQSLSSLISSGKIRASYGITGNDQISDYQYLSTYSPYPTQYFSTVGYFPAQLTNPNYAWEQVKKMEVALELGMFHERLMLSASYFRNRTDNQLVGYSLPTITGFNSVIGNLPAIIQNSGLEIELSTQNVKSKSFSWSTKFNVSTYNNKLVKYPGLQSSPYAQVFKEGKSLFVKNLLHYTGVDKSTGVYTFQDVNKDGSLTYPDDYQFLKEVKQQYFGGIGNSISYHSFQFDIFFRFVKQTGIAYNEYGMAGSYSLVPNQPNTVRDRWMNPNSQPKFQKASQDYSAAPYDAFINAVNNSDFIIRDASFIRCQNIALSYTFSLKHLPNFENSQVKIYSQIQNLFTITGYPGLDPETQSLVVPPLRTIVFGIQVTL